MAWMDWRTIETAPKDGRDMLLAAGDRWSFGWWESGTWWVSRGDWTPTHWTPVYPPDRNDPPLGWQEMDSAPTDGSAFLAYGVHTQDDCPGAARGVKRGDHWWGIILWDIWRSPAEGAEELPRWVFSKDGAPAWSEPMRWQRLTVPWPFDEPLVEHGGPEDGPGAGLIP